MSERGYRKERIERLLRELEYEVTRGMMDAEIDETIGFRFLVPVSKQIKDGVVLCEFQTRPVHRGIFAMDEGPARLRVVKDDAQEQKP